MLQELYARLGGRDRIFRERSRKMGENG